MEYNEENIVSRGGFCASMDKQQLAERSNQAFLSFWAIGDLHFREHEQWKALHTPRMEQMFADLHAIWSQEGQPAFCVSPGDVVDRGAPGNYQFARRELSRYLGEIPFYPGLGNHEYYPEKGEGGFHTAEEYCAAWGRPVRYAWTAGKDERVICIMLDHFFGDVLGEKRTLFRLETLAFLEATLTEHARRIAVIFAHCPLHNTVLDRDPIRHLDDDSLTPFFYVENSSEVRAILARYPNAALYLSGHTHSGWGSPQLLFTETLGEHSLAHLNLMCPWYTGFHGARRDTDGTTLVYDPDNPDLLASFAVQIYPHKALIRVRDHRAGQWICEWEVPV